MTPIAHFEKSATSIPIAIGTHESAVQTSRTTFQPAQHDTHRAWKKISDINPDSYRDTRISSFDLLKYFKKYLHFSK